jgi:hypothetical protein
MYYSAVIDKSHGTDKVLEIVKSEGIEVKVYQTNTFQGSQMLELANEQGAFLLPLIMAGDTVVGEGDMAWLELYEHSQANPHVHWEAGDEGDTV